MWPSRIGMLRDLLRAMKHIACWIGLGIVGCAGVDSPEPEPPVATVTSSLTGENEQGVYILGARPDDMLDPTTGRHFRVDVHAVDPGHDPDFTIGVSPSGVGAHLVAKKGTSVFMGASGWFDNLILRGIGFPWQVRIEPGGAVSDGKITRYHLKRQRVVGGVAMGAWEEYCADSTVGAIPIRGGYNLNRDHADIAALSFACDEDGVAAKCPVWGYVAGDQALPGRDTDWNRNQACTRMANAWYCPNQGPHTRSGTPIQYGNFPRDGVAAPYDVPIYPLPAPLPGDPDAFSFEAGWSPAGPVCLSKLRWQSLPPRPCDGTLPDPRTREGRLAGGVFCDELSYAEIRTRGALLVNGSKLMDAPVHRWASTTNGDVVMSMGGYVSNSDPMLVEVVAPTFRLPGPSPYTPGTLAMDHLILRNLPSSLDPVADMVVLNRYVDPVTGDRVVLPAPPNKNYQFEAFEGYAFNSAGVMGRPEIRRCGLPPDLTTTIAASCPGGIPGTPLGVFALPPPR